MELNFDNKCRACLSESEEMMSLFDMYEHDLTLAAILESCINTEVNQNDGLSSYLCDQCVTILIQFYNFTIVYEQSEMEVKSLIKKLAKSLETDSVYDIQTEVDPSDFANDEFNLTGGSEQLDNVTDIVNLTISPEQDETSTYPETSNYFEIKKPDDYYIEENRENNIVNYVKQELNVLDEFKKEILTDELEASSNCEVNEYLQVHVENVKEIEIKEEIKRVAPIRNTPYEEYETVTKYECTCGEAHLYASSFQQHMRVKHLMPDIEPNDYVKHVRLRITPKLEHKYQSTSLSQQPNEEHETKFACNVCNKAFHTSPQLEQHSKLHDANKKYVCEVCGSRFIRRNYLADHMEGHSTEKKHVCKFCGKAFRRRTVLRAHKRVHTHPNHYICELCGRAFTNSSTLKTHKLLIHIKDRNFKCVICNLTFPLKSTLNKHVLRHQKRENGEKGFDCNYCEMQYRDKSSLKRHVETKHQGRVQLVSCTDCPKQYTSKTNLIKHRKRHHSTIQIIE